MQPAPLLPHLSHTTLHLFPFQIRGRVYRYGEKNLYRKIWYISHRKNTNVSSTAERCHLQHIFNISNHSSSIAQALAHHKFVFTLPKSVRNDPQDLQVMVTKANSIKGTWYVECDLSLPRNRANRRRSNCLVVRGKTPTTNHKDNVQDLFSTIFYSPVTLADIGISEQRKELAMQAIAEVWTTGICNPGENGQSVHDILFAQTPEGIKLRQQGEKQQALEHARERLERAVKMK